jgi:multiple sugar transport system permease protein
MAQHSALAAARSQKAVSRHRRVSGKFLVRQGLLYLILVGLALVMIFPYYWMVVNSIKGSREFTASPYSLIPRSVSLESIVYVWRTGRIGLYLKNSLIYASIVLFAQTLINSLAAYAFARVEFPGRDVLFVLVLATMMLPYSVLLIPTYLIVWNLGLANTVPGVVLPGFASAYGIFMLRQFFLNIPMELEDAARIDGCGRLRIYWQIILPLAQPALITIGLFTFMSEWSSFTWPLVVLSDWKKYPITVGLSLFRDEQWIHWDRTFAASFMATLPVVILFFAGQRYIVGGISLTGLKG